MMHLDHYYRVTLPRRAVQLIDHDTLNAVTKEAGGVSVSRNDGQWFDDAGVLHEDHNEVFQWNHYYNQTHRVRERVLDLIAGVFKSTAEKSVLIEHQTGDGYSAKVMFPTDPQRMLP